MALIIMLALWKVWKGRNVRVFHHHGVCKIKEEARVWSLARAKKLSNVISGE
jgi:hypothetical protein